MKLNNLLASNAKKLEKEINRVLVNWRREAFEASPELISVIDKFIKANQGGKRIRGFLINLGFQLACLTKPGGKRLLASGSYDEIKKIAAAFEIFHTSILIHDDIIDQSPLRRGKPSLYKSLGGGHYGISQAISLADCGFFIAIKVIAESNFSPIEKVEAIKFFSQTVIETGMGEILDVELPYRRKWDERDVIKIMDLKTARYTVANPLQLGALLAGATKIYLRLLDRFGYNLGVAFQIQDDILGVFGSSKQTGKSTTSDIEEGKNTLLIIEAIKKANQKQKAILKKYYGKGVLSQKGLQEVRKVFIETGALDFCKSLSIEYIQKAKLLISGITTDENMTKLLNDLTEYLVERKK